MASAVETSAAGYQRAARTEPGARGRHRTTIGYAVFGALVGAALMAVAHRALIDDTYITLSYVRNMVTDFHWGLIPTEESNAATSPLNVLLLSAATWLVSLLTGDVRPVLGLSVLTVVLTALLTGWAAATAQRLGRSGAWSLAVLAVVLANPFVNSSLGLEVVLESALLVGLLGAAVSGRRVSFGVLAGLLVLTRLDLAVIVAVVFLLSPSVRRPLWRAPLIAAVVAGPWFVFSWFHFGSAIPDTFVIKTLQKSFGEATFANGLWEWWGPRGWLPLWIALVPAAVGLLTLLALLVAGARRRLRPEQWPIAGLALGGVAYFGAYSALGVPPYQWYYVPTTVSLGVAGVLGIALLTGPVAGRRRITALAGPVVVTVALVVAYAVALPGPSLVWDRATYFGNWAMPQQALEIGAEVGDLVGDDTVLAPPEIGTLAYACGCSIVDPFSDRGRSLELVEERIDEAGPLGRRLLEWNFSRLDRDQQPRPAQYELVYSYDPPPPGLPSWPVSSPATGNATYYLQPLP